MPPAAGNNPDRRPDGGIAVEAAYEPPATTGKEICRLGSRVD